MNYGILSREAAKPATAETRVERLQKAVTAGRSGYDLAQMSDDDALKILSRRDAAA